MKIDNWLPVIGCRSRVMGIINLTARSFHNAFDVDTALRKSEQMVREGAAYLDVGAIATNPTINLKTDIPSEQQELDIVIPFIEKLSKTVDVIISVDTFRAKVMEASVHAGAKMINDQRALTEENALAVAVKLAVPVCLMHHLSHPEPLKQYAERCLSAGIKKENIILDPGFGGGNYGKTAAENFYMLAHLEEVVRLGYPVLVGLSRKSFLGELVNKPIEERLAVSVAAAMIASQKGASIIRVHDVAETVDALRVLEAI